MSILASVGVSAPFYINGSDTASNSWIGLKGGIAFKRQAVVDAGYTVSRGDYIVGYSSLTTSHTATLPDATLLVGRSYIIKDETNSAATNNITIATTSAQTIDGSSTKVININNGWIIVYSDGSNWRISGGLYNTSQLSDLGGFSNPMTTLGDTIYENSTPSPTRLAGNTTSTKKFLTQTGTGSVSAAPGWNTIAAGDVPTLNQNTTGTAADLSATLIVAHGGTGAISLTGLIVGNGTSAMTAVTAPSGTVVGTTDTQTLTNKRVTQRIVSIASSSTPTPNGDTTDIYELTALAVGATFGAPTGTPNDGDKLIIRIKDNGTAQSLAWNAIYRFSSDLAAPTTTVISKTMYLGFIYNSADSKWDNIAQLNNF